MESEMDEFKLAFISSPFNSAETLHKEEKKRKETSQHHIILNEWFIYDHYHYRYY